MRRFLVLAAVTLGVFNLALFSAQAKEPRKEQPPNAQKTEIPLELRIQLWSKYLDENPDTPYREAILHEIDRALKALWGSIVNPFAPGMESDDSGLSFEEALRYGKIVNPFAGPPMQPRPSSSSIYPWGSGRQSMLSQEAIELFQSGKLVDPFVGPPGFAEDPSGPFSSEDAPEHGKLLNPFRAAPLPR